MSFQAVETADAVISSTAVLISSSSFGFASTNLIGAQKATVYASTVSKLFLSITGTAPTTIAGIPIAAGEAYVITGSANVARIQVIGNATDSTVTITVEK